MARNHQRRLRKRQQFLVNGAENLARIAAGQIRAPDAVAEQRVARDQLVLRGNPDRDAPLRVPRRVEDVELGIPERELVALAGFAIDLGARRGRYAQPGRLGIQVGIKLGVVLVHVYGRAGKRLEFGRAPDVVDMGVGDHDGLHREPVPVEKRGDVRDIIARIDNDGLAGLLVSKNRAVALQHAHRKNLVNHIPIVYSGCILGVDAGSGILVAVGQKVVSEAALPAHYSAWFGMCWIFLT